MRLSTKYFIFVLLIISGLVILAFPYVNTKPFLFVAVEILVILSIIFSLLLYRSLIRPVKLISSGIENIKDKDFSAKLNKVDQKDMDQLINVYNKMIDQLRNERIQHQEQNLFLDKLLDASPAGIVILDFDGKVTELNTSAEKLLGLNPGKLVGRKLGEFPGEFFEKLDQIADGEAVTIKLSGINVIKAHKAHFMDKGSKRYFIILEELTDEILKAEKKSYDKIIRMMSHEINNSIGAINSILNSFLNFSGQLNADDSKDFIHAINVAVDRNNKLNKFMANFAEVVRIPAPRKSLTNLNKLIADVTALMNPICRDKNIDLSITEKDTNLYADLDSQQIEQSLVNIIKNSIESIGSDGKIEVEIHKGQYPEIIIRDDGKGIEKEIQPLLFTPFYSSKTNGQGIGLTLIREILVNHGFGFSLATNESGKTEFKIQIYHPLQKQ